MQHAPEQDLTHWDWTLHTVDDEDRNIVGVLLNFVDVTEHLKTQQALIMEKQLTDPVLESAGAVVVLDASGKVVRFNRA